MITLTGTMLGAFLALYLANWTEVKKNESQKEIAIQNILSEISSNEETLVKSLKNHQQIIESIIFFRKHLDSTGRLVASSSEMGNFISKNPDVLELSDSTLLENGQYQYHGESEINKSLVNISLTNIAWETLKNSALSAKFNFQCLMYFESIDKIKSEIIKKDQILMEAFFQTGGNIIYDEYFYNNLTLLLELEKGLIQVYKNKDKGLENCL